MTRRPRRTSRGRRPSFRDAGLAQARPDGRARGRSEDGGARSARGTERRTRVTAAPTTSRSCARTSLRSGRRSDAELAGVELATSRSATGGPARARERRPGSRARRVRRHRGPERRRQDDAAPARARARATATRARVRSSAIRRSGARRRPRSAMCRSARGSAARRRRRCVRSSRPDALAGGGLLGPLAPRRPEAVDERGRARGARGSGRSPLRTLSGGMQQRAFIAKALAAEPSLLVLDEPTTGVDAESQESLAAAARELHRELGVTILYVSHEFGAVEHFVERLVLVRGGIVFDGAPSGLPGVWHDPSHHHDPRMLDLEFMRLAFAPARSSACSRRPSASSSSSARRR